MEKLTGKLSNKRDGEYISEKGVPLLNRLVRHL